jgi:hypothetical protein
MMAEGKAKDEAQKMCAIQYYKQHGMTPQEAEKKMKAHAELNNIEIFEAGTYRGKTYTDADLDTMVKNFDELKGEIKPVAVIGHDENQDLLKQSGLFSAGWMESVRKVGTKLVASFKDVPQLLADLINKGAFKRISSEIYNDYNGKGLALRRVAILGGDIPEVKTLQDIAALYSDSPTGNTTWVPLAEAAPESDEKEKKNMDDLKKMQEELTALSGQVTALAEENKKLKATMETPPDPKQIFDMDVQDLAEKVSYLTENIAKMQEESKAKEEKIKALETDNQATVTKLSEAEKKRKTDDIKRFVSDRMKEGRISPAIWGLGLEKFMAELDDASVSKFGEGKRTAELTPLGFMKNLILTIPRNTLVRFGELASVKIESAQDAGTTASDKLAEATKKIMDANKDMKFTEAFSQAQRENPELATEYAADIIGH